MTAPARPVSRSFGLAGLVQPLPLLTLASFAALALLIVFTFRGWIKRRNAREDWQINDT